MSAGVSMVEGYINEDLQSFTANNQQAYRGTLRVPDSRKMLDGSWGSMFKDFVVWPGSSAYRTLERLSQSGKPIGAGAQVKLVMLETEAEYTHSDGSKRVSTNYEALDISFVSRSSKSVSDTANATATSVVDTPQNTAPGGITL